jgi:arylsulfatase A-like enzyme
MKHSISTAAVLALLLGSAVQSLALVDSKQAKPLNVVIIMTDDQGGWDYGFMGNKLLSTPNLDAMAARGARLSRFYVSPVCTPTRASLMTGRYNYRTRAIDTYLGRAMMEPDETTIAELLAPAGYATGIFGKWHLGDSYPMRPQDQGFQEVLVHRGGGIGQPSDPPEGARKYTDPVLFHNGEKKQMKGYVTDVIFNNAMAFIEKNNKLGKPTFSYISTNAPHGPYHDVPEDLREKYQAMDLTDAYGFSFSGIKKFKRNDDVTSRVFSMIENIDDNVGRFFKHLKKIKAYDNTLVLFLNDNGPNGSRYVGPHRGHKSQIYEGGIRSVLLAHWPDQLKAGTVNDRIAAHYDILPTILAAAGVKSTEQLALDGINIMPLLKGKTPDWPERSLFLQWHRGDQPSARTNAAVIGQRYKMIFTRENAPGQLYHLQNDPAENKNLASKQPKLAQQLTAQYNEWFNDVSSTRRDNYQPPRIHIGNDSEPTTVLTRQDWRYSGPVGKGWNQKARGKWLVTVDNNGLYSIKVYFKPKAIASVKLKAVIGSQQVTATVAKGETEFEFKNVKLTSGDQSIEVFVSEGGSEYGPMLVYLSKV